jgi:hypothetical protein
MDNDMWSGQVGDSVRAIFAFPVDGLPQQEPLFTLKQYPHVLFEGFITTTRIALIIKKSNTEGFEIRFDAFAKPQTTVHIQGKTNESILAILNKNQQQVVSAFKKQELTENQNRIKKSLLDDSKIKQKFGISLKLPDAYRYIIEEDKFFWIRKETQSGNTSVIIYEVPISQLQNNQDVIQNIIEMRDTIGKKHIEGTLPNTFMVTEASYAPYLFNIYLTGRKTIETKGTWELKNDFMAGPFINYAILDEANNRYLVLEGFCYNPSSSKRDLIFELEAILKSVQFLK